MIARLQVQLPFEISVPDGQEYNLSYYEHGLYLVRVLPPFRSKTLTVDNDHQVFLNGIKAFSADIVRVEFIKDSFDRCVVSPDDPPLPLMEEALNSFLRRLRHVAKAPRIHPIELDETTWRVEYLNDDGTLLEAEHGFITMVGGIRWNFAFNALTKEVWEDVHRLPLDYEPNPWDELLLDAQREMPNIGAGIVLAATALEVFISRILDKLASRSTFPGAWAWINSRNYHNPTVEEQFDSLLKMFTSHSLKEDSQHWESFMRLKRARNSFVHEGLAKIGKMQVDETEAKKLIDSASAIILRIRDWLPSDLLWPTFRNRIDIRILKPIPWQEEERPAVSEPT
ncbi:MAG: hypothetical protein AB7F94_18625 [Nitrospira sp.]